MSRVCRSRRYARYCRIIISAIVFSIFGSFFLLKMPNAYRRNFVESLHHEQANVIVEQASDCACFDNSTGLYFNFCYRLPDKYGVQSIGRRFSCEHLPIVRRLGLLDTNMDEYFRFDDDRSINAAPDSLLPPPFVTAASGSHFRSILTLIKTVQKYTTKHRRRIIVYDLGLSDGDVGTLKKLCDVEVRRFNFSMYPTWVKSLAEYRWKPILIAESVKQYGVIWYMDSSVQLEKSNLSHVYALLNCRQRFDSASSHEGPYAGPFYAPRNGVALVEPNFIESGFHTNLWRESVRRCDKFAYMLHGFTGHGIYSATNPGVYKYIPTDVERLKQDTCKMYEAGHVLVARTVEVVHDVLKWYVLCALEKDCMSPPDASLSCSFKSDRYSTYANCHRFDQSVVNLLLANRNYFDSYYWTSNIVDFFHIVRGGGGIVAADRNASLEECL